MGFLWVQGCKLRGSQLPSPTISSTFLQGTMDLRHALITYPQRHLTNSACCLRTFNNFYLPPSPPSVEYGGERGRGGYGVTYLLRTFDPPSKRKSSGARFWGGLTYTEPSPSGKNTKGSKLLLTFFERPPCLHPTERVVILRIKTPLISLAISGT